MNTDSWLHPQNMIPFTKRWSSNDKDISTGQKIQGPNTARVKMQKQFFAWKRKIIYRPEYNPRFHTVIKLFHHFPVRPHQTLKEAIQFSTHSYNTHKFLQGKGSCLHDYNHSHQDPSSHMPVEFLVENQASASSLLKISLELKIETSLQVFHILPYIHT